MYSKYQSIVLHSFPYTESKRIIHCYTKEAGRQSFMLYVKKGAKAKGVLAHYQPLSVIEIEASGSGNQKMHTIKNAKSIHHFTSLPFDPVKQMQVMFMAELCYAVLQQESDNEALYSYLEYAIVYLDTSGNGKWAHVKFMIDLCTYLGFRINTDLVSSTHYFNPFTGCFEVYASPETSSSEIGNCIKCLSKSSFTELEELKFSNTSIADVIDCVLSYYRNHVSGFKTLKTVEYFRKI